MSNEWENEDILEPTKEERDQGKTGYEGSQSRMYDAELSFLEDNLQRYKDQKEKYDRLFQATHNAVFYDMSNHCDANITTTQNAINGLNQSIQAEKRVNPNV